MFKKMIFLFYQKIVPYQEKQTPQSNQVETEKINKNQKDSMK